MSKALRIAGWITAAVAILLIALLAHLYVEGRPPQGRAQYVAMGSSFASGPAIKPAAEDSPWFCARSRDNYAHQFARLRGLSLVDTSCGGATSRHILDGGQLMQPAQIEAVTRETELVTVTIGGNDIAYIGNMMAMGCNDDTSWLLRKAGACRVRGMAEIDQALAELGPRLARIAEEVHRRAPAAKLVFLNYQTVLPDSGSCERLGLTAEQAAQMRVVTDKLADLTRATAEAHGALLLDARALTRGHDACASDPWMNGMRPAGGMLAAPLHPTLAGMTALAQGLDTLLQGR